MPRCRRSAISGKRDRFDETFASLTRSSWDMPVKFVPQMTALDTGANRAIVSTAVASWKRPWPNSSGRAA